MRAKNVAGWALLALLLGCGERRDGIDVAPSIVDRARLGDELLFVDASRNEVDALKVMDKTPTPTVQRIRVGAGPRLAVERLASVQNSVLGSSSFGAEALADASLASARRSPEEVLVLSDGKRDEGGDYTEKPALTVVKRDHKTRKYELSAPLNTVTLSSDGRYALLWGQPTSDPAGGLLNNPNRVALIDLDREPTKDSNPYERTLKATGGSVASVLISPPISYAGQERPIALFGFDNGVNAWDLANPDHEDITVEGLSVNNQFALTRVVVDTANAQLYLIQRDQGNLRVLSLLERDNGSSNDFRIALNQLALGTTAATDMVFYTDVDIPKVLVTTGGQLGMVDANDGRVVSVKLTAAGERLHIFTGESPNDNDTKQRVLVWGAGKSTVSFVELGNLEKAGTQNIEELPLGSGYVLSDLVPLYDNLMLTVLQSGGIGTLDLETRRFRPLSSGGGVRLTSPLIESDARRVWVGGSQDSRIGYFEPVTLATGSLRLDQPVQELFVFENDKERKVVTCHENPLGEVTIVDATKATRASSRILTGFLVDGLVER